MEQIKRILNRIIDDLRKCGIAIIVIILYLFICSVIFGTVCPMVILTGFPCPGCGLTRAVVSILCGDFAAGFKYNPAAFFWIIYIVSFLCNRYIKVQKAMEFVKANAKIKTPAKKKTTTRKKKAAPKAEEAVAENATEATATNNETEN